MKKIILVISFILVGTYDGICQDSIAVESCIQKRNIIHWNITPMILWSVNGIVLGYERLIDANESLVISAGYQEFPKYKEINEDEFIRLDYVDRTGFRFSAEYRFYWKSRNTNPAPDGLYIGPYISYFYFDIENNFQKALGAPVVEDLVFKGRISRYSMGFQLGYQFIIANKLSIDLMMLGPSISIKDGNLRIEGNISEEQKTELFQEMLDNITDSFPTLINKISDSELESNGDFFNWGIGFRYMLQIGYYF
jgi:hypothetical protein